MLISTHVLVGTALGRALSAAYRPGRPLGAQLAVAAVAGVASHLACDALPHWGTDGGGDGYRSREFLAVAVPDGLAGLALLAGAVLPEGMPRKAIVAATALGACLPDADKPSELLTGKSPWPDRFDAFHGRIQRESPRMLPFDVAVIAGLSWLLLGRRRRRTSASP